MASYRCYEKDACPYASTELSQNLVENEKFFALSFLFLSGLRRDLPLNPADGEP